jgi:riboflavin kinase/FMN adenylyltransferase
LKLIRHIDELTAAEFGGALTMGNFDGVHAGHARIIERLRHWATKVSGPSVVFTFDPHPVRLLRPHLAPPPLTWTQRKAELLGQLGIDVMIAWPTDKALLQLTYKQFFSDIIQSKIAASAIVEGPNFQFGHNREGNIERLGELCQAANIRFEVVQPAIHGETLISSTRIRQAIAAGDVQFARSVLTQPYRIRGMVVHGAGRGATLGFATANLDAIDTLIPGMGIYAGLARVRGITKIAAIHIGPSPTFGANRPQVEIHLLDFGDSVYGEIMEVDFLQRLRGVEKFPTVDLLLEQMEVDVQQALHIGRDFLNSSGPR